MRLATGKVTRIPAPRGTTSIALAPGNARALATHLTEGLVTIVDLATLATTAVDVGLFPVKAVVPSPTRGRS